MDTRSMRGLIVLSCFHTLASWTPLSHASLRARPLVMSANPKPLEKALPAPPMPTSCNAQWEVHKFGGASLATAELYAQCSDLLVSESRREIDELGGCIPTMAVVSAKGGVTDRLISVVQAARNDMDEAERLLHVLASEQIDVVRELAGSDVASSIESLIREDEKGILNVIRAVGLLRTIPGSTMELVTGFGEVWSAMTMYAYLESKGVPTAWLDAREVLIVEQSGFGLGDKGSANVVGVDPLWGLTGDKLQEWFAAPTQAGLTAADCKTAAPIVIVTGFVASTLEGTRTTLKRSGSDFSATIFARLMSASRITMWKNVNGVYTADPRRVPEAFPIESLKYDEAIELAYFGAQVLHPSAMLPCIEGQIPIYVRNVFNPSHPGTVIQGRAATMENSFEAWRTEADAAKDQSRKAACPVRLGENESPIRGVTSVDSVAILNVEGTGTSAVPDLTSRIFLTLDRANIGVTMLTQASADASMCVVIEEGDAARALAALEAAFESELNRGLVGGITVERDHSVVAIVGEGMAFRPGTGATFTKAMANAGVNIRTIAQGSSERQISICVEKSDCTKALRAAHAALALSNTQLSIAVIGASGLVGSEFLSQIAESRRVIDEPSRAGRRKALDDLRLDFKVTALARSSSMRLSYDGIQDCSGGACLNPTNDAVKETDLEELTKFLNEDYNGNRVVIDCTASEEVAAYYTRWLGGGIHVISASKKAGSGGAELYDECRRLATSRAQWYYETTGPGSGLPVLSTLKDMTQSGDIVSKVSGIFSGSVSFILNGMYQGQTLSAALAAAIDEGLCEPDPREDLNGVDVRRKVVVLARELGLQLEMADVPWENPLLPPELVKWKPQTHADAPSVAMQLVEAIKPYDEELGERVRGMCSKGELPIQLCEVDVEAGTASVALVPVAESESLSRCLSNENMVQIRSRRYDRSPMVLQGPGAGPRITASGLFADLLHLSRTLVEWNIPKID